MGGDNTSPCEAREEGRLAALAGREVWTNPHIGSVAEEWFAGYRAVPDADRGTCPDVRPKARRVRKKAGRGRAIGRAIAAAVEEASARMPKPWSEL